MTTATQTCIGCKAEKQVESQDGWLFISVAMCNDCLAAEEAPAVLAADDEFDAILRLEARVNDHRITAEVGHTQMARNQGRHDWKAARRNLHAAIDLLDLDRLRAYGEYRKAARAGLVR